DPERHPIAGASVVLAGLHGTEGVGTLTDADGRFRIPAAPMAQIVMASHAGFRSAVAQALPGGGPIEIILPRAEAPVTLRGRFRDADGKALAGTVVTFDGESGTPVEGRV